LDVLSVRIDVMRLRPLLALLAPLVLSAPAPMARQGHFAKLVERLSEGEGYFPSDNLVTNENSYLHVLGGLEAMGVRGGAYLGVGPEQSFSYIATIHPEVAILIDIRRDNMLLHLLLKAMFASAHNRLEYLCLLYGRAPPEELYLWTEADLGAILDYIDRTPADTAVQRDNHRRLMKAVTAFGVPLSDQDRATARRFHDEFAAAGLDIRYSTRSRRLRLDFPSNRMIYLEVDREGRQGSYLATEDRWRSVRDLQLKDRVIPVVGDLAGPSAVRKVGDYLREIGLTVSALYVSNVEQYLFRGGVFPLFVDNVRNLPTGPQSVLIRSWFSRRGSSDPWPTLPSHVPGYRSTQLLQTFARFHALTRQPELVDYWTLVTDVTPHRAVVPPR
jgi:hypothetical protein